MKSQASPLLLAVNFGDRQSPSFPSWRSVVANGLAEALASLADNPALILLGHPDAAIVGALRASDLPAAAAPIAVLGAAVPADADLGLPAALSPSEIAAALDAWRPVAIPAAYLRIEASFGKDTIAGMAVRFRDVLIDALAALETLAVSQVAHRVAGVAGTLGFDELGKLWLRVSLDPADQPATLVAETRRTITAITQLAVA